MTERRTADRDTTREAGRHHLIAVGSNLGDRVAAVRGARAELERRLQVPVVASRMFRTAPMYIEDQPEFVNAAFAVTCALEPSAMLELLLDVERAFGRDRQAVERYGARSLDLDLVAVDDVVMSTERLALPHPRMQERGFVLAPLCDVAPDWVHPVLRRSARELLAQLVPAGSEDTVVAMEESW